MNDNSYILKSEIYSINCSNKPVLYLISIFQCCHHCLDGEVG